MVNDSLVGHTMASKAELANQILDNPVFHAALTNVKQNLFTLWCNSRQSDVEQRERLYAEYNAAGRIMGAIVKYVSDYQLEKDREEKKAANYGIV